VVTRSDFTREVVGKAADGTPLYRKDLSLHLDDGTLDGVTLQSCHPHLGDFGKFTPAVAGTGTAALSRRSAQRGGGSRESRPSAGLAAYAWAVSGGLLDAKLSALAIAASWLR
jgi:hypothetical protein